MGALAQAASRIARGESTSVAEVAAALERIDVHNERLNVFTVVASDDAMRDARSADAAAGGVLRGVPVAVKDLFDVAGWETSACSRLYEGRVAVADAWAVAALRRAGAVVVGKTNMHELALGATNDASSYGPPHNPYDVSRMTGGSSGGSAAAVAAGLVPLALGTDTGGSVRIPASLCGVAGLKTTHGLLPLDGTVPLSPSMDTIGPLAGDVEDLALAMLALCELNVRWLDDASGLTIGIARNRSFETVDPAVDAGVRDAIASLERAGARVVDVELPDAERARDTWTDVALPEFLGSHPGLDASKLTEELQFIAAAAAHVDDATYREAKAAMQQAWVAWARAFERVDAIAMPSTPVGAPPHFAAAVEIGGAEVPVHGGLLSSKTRQVNVAGVPAVSIPCGIDDNGMPFGLQLACARGEDAKLLAVARLAESAIAGP